MIVLTGAMLAGCADRQFAGPAAAPLEHPATRTEWSFAGVRGQRLTTGHYHVFCTTANPVLRDGIAGFMEAARANYVSLTGLAEAAAGKKMKVYLFGTREEWAMLTEKIVGASSRTVLKLQAGGYCYAGICVFWDFGSLPTYRTAAHEGMHQFLHHATRQSLPIWAEEGLAVQSEGFVLADGLVSFDATENIGRLTTLRKTILAGRWRPIDRLVSMSSQDNLAESTFHGADYYSQLWALLLFLRSEPAYNEGLRRLCRDAADGTIDESLAINPRQWARLERNNRAYTSVVGKKTFTHYIDADMPGFEQRYLAFARKLAKLD